MVGKWTARIPHFRDREKKAFVILAGEAQEGNPLASLPLPLPASTMKAVSASRTAPLGPHLVSTTIQPGPSKIS